MRCRTCGSKAVLNMPQHRLALCKAHYLEWLPAQTLRAISKFGMFAKSDKVLVAVSGGKDSLALWDILSQLGYKTDGLYIDLGIDDGTAYSRRSGDYAQTFADQRGLKLITVNVCKEYSETLPQMTKRTLRGRDKPCSICGLVKRHILNRVSVEGGYDTLATAHNLDDEAAILLANTLDWSLEHLSRGQPVLPAGPGFTRKVKPFCCVYERESAAYSVLRGIAFMPDECPHSAGSKQLYFKTYLNEWEEKMPGAKLRFYNNYLKALESGAFPMRQEAPEDLATQRCPSCGQPTTSGGLCSFCTLVGCKNK
ncbi:MAG: adenine nucleotide alpha hydrolase family protein [Anaerolineaceae bacterium]|nr:adenine nucleotide alpha hydrolase family protein [Anaerolineaceae bacterium]